MLLLLISGTAITAPCATPSAGSTRGTNGKDPYADVFELLLFGNTWTRAPAPARSSFYGLTVANLCSMLVVLTQSGRWRMVKNSGATRTLTSESYVSTAGIPEVSDPYTAH
jgi:hypothetical protein